MTRPLIAALTVTSAVLLAQATPASATLTTVGACSTTDLSATVSACSGWFDGNLLNANKGQDQFDALKLIGFTWDKTGRRSI